MKRLIAGMAAALLAAVLFFPCKVQAISAGSSILLDAQTGRVLYEKNAHQRSLIASTTKIMTALVICEQCNVLDRVRIPKEAVGIEGSSMYLREGEILTIQELLYGLMLHSGNDAATALAIYCGGTVEGFAELMNDKARSLNMKNSHFVNPHGLDNPEHYSTAEDLAVLAAYAMENPIFAKTVSSKSVTIGKRHLTNHNKLLWQVEGAEGVKTGYTKAAGRILVSSVSRQGRRLIAVTINAPDDWRDHKILYDQGFSQYCVYQLVRNGQSLGSIEIAAGEENRVELLAGEDFSYPLRKDEQVQIRMSEPGFAYAPVVEGASAGFAHIFVDHKPVGKVSVVYGQSVEEHKQPKVNKWKKFIDKVW